jgi:hypothetical protein
MRGFFSMLVLVLFSQSAGAQSVEEQLREMRAEIQRLRQEVDELKQDLKARNETLDTVPLLQAAVEEYAQTKVESASKLPLRLFGTIVSNTFFNTREANWLDIPNIATPEASGGATAGSFSSSLRQTRIGATFDGPSIAGMKLNGTAAVDFFGGIPNFQTGQVMGLPRLLYAYMRLDGEKTAFEIGQDHMILAPRNPTSLAGTSFPTLYRSGNLYLRAPQLRAEQVVASGQLGQFRVIGGILAPVAGDLTNSPYQFVPPNLAGERSRTPAMQSRLSWRATPAGPYEQPDWEIGASGHYGRERYATGIDPSWAASIDFDINPGRFGLGGEYFVGRNIDAFGGSIAQIAKSNGGFLEGRIAATSRLNFAGGYGADHLFHLVRRPAALSRNSTIFANGIYSFTPEFRAGLEYQRLLTRRTDSRSDRNHHFNLTFAYSF